MKIGLMGRSDLVKGWAAATLEQVTTIVLANQKGTSVSDLARQFWGSRATVYDAFKRKAVCV